MSAKKHITLLFLTGIIALLPHFATAQTSPDTSSVRHILRAKSMGDSVVVRWADVDHIRWAATRRAGYDIFRVELDAQMNAVGEARKLNDLPIKPMLLDQMRARYAQNDTVAAVVAQVLHGAFHPVDGSGLEGLDAREAEQSNRHAYALFLADVYARAADALGWRWVDRDIQAGKTYYYILASDTRMYEQPADTSGVLVSIQPAQNPPKLETLEYTPFDGELFLGWSRLEGESQFTAYEIHRNDGPGTAFRNLTPLPWTETGAGNERTAPNMLYHDSLTVNYTLYTYRVRGVDSFGDWGEWAEITAQSVDLTPPIAPSGVNAVSEGGSKVRITWEKPYVEDDLFGFLVARSNELEGFYVPLDSTILMPDLRSFLDANAVTWDRNYYTVSAIDTAGNVSRSVPVYAVIADSIGPAKTTGLQASIDTTGIVRLSWDLGAEPDLHGYQVYRANQADHAFQVLTRAPLLNTVFVDSVELYSLTKSVFYQVIAFDNAGNPGDASDILEVRKPDLVPPEIPVIHDFSVSDSLVQLRFSPSNSPDVALHRIFRSEGEDAAHWQQIAQTSGTDSLYVDRNFLSGQLQWYAVAAEDSSGNLSEYSFPMRIKAPERAVIWPDIRFTSEVDEETDAVFIRWTINGELPQGARMMIYRAIGDSGWRQYRQADPAKGEFEDQKISDEVHRWALRLLLPDGRMGPLIEP